MVCSSVVVYGANNNPLKEHFDRKQILIMLSQNIYVKILVIFIQINLKFILEF